MRKQSASPFHKPDLIWCGASCHEIFSDSKSQEPRSDSQIHLAYDPSNDLPGLQPREVNWWIGLGRENGGMLRELSFKLLEQIGVSNRGGQWLSVRVERYSAFSGASRKQRLALDRSLFIGLLCLLRDAGVPASNRLRVVLVLGCYRGVFLCVEVPSLKDIAMQLVEIAERESHVVEPLSGMPSHMR